MTIISFSVFPRLVSTSKMYGNRSFCDRKSQECLLLLKCCCPLVATLVSLHYIITVPKVFGGSEDTKYFLQKKSASTSEIHANIHHQIIL